MVTEMDSESVIYNQIGCLYGEQNNTKLTLLMLNTGTHADLFGKTKR